jgi:hypothetical protein
MQSSHMGEAGLIMFAFRISPLMQSVEGLNSDTDLDVTASNTVRHKRSADSDLVSTSPDKKGRTLCPVELATEAFSSSAQLPGWVAPHKDYDAHGSCVIFVPFGAPSDSPHGGST